MIQLNWKQCSDLIDSFDLKVADEKDAYRYWSDDPRDFVQTTNAFLNEGDPVFIRKFNELVARKLSA